MPPAKITTLLLRNFLSILFLITLCNHNYAQSAFSFNCRKDTTIECTTSCISLNTVIPDIHSSTASYSVNQITAFTCFRGYVNPAVGGRSANITADDIYSSPLNISFPFSFYGSNYSSLVASTNGYLSFDISLANKRSHFGILNRNGSLTTNGGMPEDLPSSLYDRALIMGPYQDLDVKNALPTTQIKYDIIGTAPYRKFILSYSDVPLYTTACLNLNPNTHQIVLYETLGIVEVFIYDKAICLNWNNGRAMIGMQNFNKSAAIMAPNRAASSAPWGNKGMSESWRFVPASGASLFKRTELYTLSGTFIGTGTTYPIPNDLIGVNFPKVCPPSAGETYLVKSFYTNPVDPAKEILNVDTINISRGDPIRVDITPTSCAAGSLGDIVVTNPVGAQYEYSMDGVTWQTSTMFKKPVGTYTLRARIIGSNCISSKVIDMFADTFDAIIITTITPCPGPLSASIEVTPRHGTAPYKYSLTGGATFQSSNIFSGLSEGNYDLVVIDAAGCVFTRKISITISNLASAEIKNTVCGAAGTGSIKVIPGYGKGPYTYSLNGGPFQSSDIFNNLTAGTYRISINDSSACAYTFDVTVNADVNYYANPTITMPSCYGNTNGSFVVHPVMGAAPYLFALESGPYQSDSLFNNLAAGSYILHIKDSVGCIKDTTIIVQQPNELGITTINTSASTCTSADGSIFIKANGGTTPYTYSIDSSKTFTALNTFYVVAGEYPIVVKDSNGCITTGSTIVDALDKAMKVDLGSDKNLCEGRAVKLIPQTTPKANFFTWSPATGLDDSTKGTPLASPLDTTTYILTAKSIVCIGSDTITVNVLHKPIAHAGNDTIICFNSSGILQGSATNTSGSVSYLWSPSSELLSPNSATTVVTPVGIRPHTYTLQVTDNYGCNFKTIDKVTVVMNGPVPAFAGHDTIASIGVPHQLMGSGGIQYLWSPAYPLNNPSIIDPVAILQNDTRFDLIVKDTLGCIGTSSVLVKVYKGTKYYVPNAFTPNGDGLNDIFKAIAPGIQRTNYFRIYNRWGQLMFQTQDVRLGWDGNYLGVPQPAAVYVWVIKGLDVTGNTIELRGTVTLIR